MKARLLIVILLGALVMKLKYMVQAENAAFFMSKSQINSLEEEIEILEAEYIYLTRPSRVLEYAKSHGYEMRTAQVKTLNDYLMEGVK